MANDFFDSADYSALVARTLARADLVNAVFTAIIAGFDKLPAELAIKQDRVAFGTDTGAANAYVVTLPHAPPAYVNGARIGFIAANTNTGASTVNVNGLGVVPLTGYGGAALTSGAIPAGALVIAGYDGSGFQAMLGSVASNAIVLPVAVANGGTGASTAAGARTALDVPGLSVSNTFSATQLFTEDVTLRSVEDGADSGPDMILDRASPTPADNDTLGAWVFKGRNDAGTPEVIDYASIVALIRDVTDGTEDGRLSLRTIVNSVLTAGLNIEGGGAHTPNATGGSQGADAINAGAVYDDGVLLDPRGIVRFWCDFDGTAAGPITPSADLNVVDVTDNGTGDYTVNIDTDFAGADYAVVGMSQRSAAAQGTAAEYRGVASPRAAGTVRVSAHVGGVLTDPTLFSVIGLGDQ